MTAGSRRRASPNGQGPALSGGCPSLAEQGRSARTAVGSLREQSEKLRNELAMILHERARWRAALDP
jgi:hypothetical protein